MGGKLILETKTHGKIIVKLKTLIAVIAYLFFAFGGMSHAKLIEPESLLLQILEKNEEVYQFYLQIRVSVYDPEEFAPLDEEIEENWIPFEIVEKSYLQNLAWVRDEYLIIETTDLAGKPLHLTVWEFGGKQFSKNLQTARFFQEEDTGFPYLMFFTKHLPRLKTNLTNE